MSCSMSISRSASNSRSSSMSLLHIKITHFSSVTSVIITSVVSFALCLQVSHLDPKCRKCRKHHTAIFLMSCL
jgi:hypothetical protein